MICLNYFFVVNVGNEKPDEAEKEKSAACVKEQSEIHKNKKKRSFIYLLFGCCIVN